MSLIELRDVDFRYRGNNKPVLTNINLGIEKGEFILLSGRSGCGKTSLCRCINGLIPRFYEGELTGEIRIAGKNSPELHSWELAEIVSSVFQDPRSQFFTINTTSELAFGCENLGLPSKDIKTRVSAAFKSLDIEYLKDRSIFGLSSGERQKIAVASINAISPEVYVLDEPAANLDTESTLALAELLRRLKESGKTIIVSEHKLYYLKDLCDRFIYIEDGKIKFDKSVDKSLEELKIDNEMGLRSLNPERLPKPVDIESAAAPSVKENALELKNICFSYGKEQLINNLNLGFLKGEVVGITGSNGAGKTTLARIICGLLKEKSGEVYFYGKKIPARKRSAHTFFIMQDVDYQLFTESVDEELRLGNGKVSNIDQKILKTLEQLELSEYREAHPAALSGGQKQRVTIAAANVKDCGIIVFDEPTSGLDASGMRKTAELIRALSEEGKTIIIITHDLELLSEACSRVFNMDSI